MGLFSVSREHSDICLVGSDLGRLEVSTRSENM